MKLMLLIAKGLARMDGTDAIGLAALAEAFDAVEFSDSALRQALADGLAPARSLRTGVDAAALAREQESAPPLKFSAEVKDLLNKLGSNAMKASCRVRQVSPTAAATPGDAPVVTTDSAPGLRDELRTLRALQSTLQERVYGQSDAIRELCDGLARASVLRGRHGPRAHFLFVGPSASGKALLARELAAALAPSGYGLFEVDMAHITHEAHSARLDGEEKGFIGAAPGALTSAVRDNPRTVVLLRNIDLCHPNVLQRLTPMLSEGVLRDRFGFSNSPGRSGNALVDFSSTIVILTTRAAEAAHTGDALLASATSGQIESQVLQELRTVGSTIRQCEGQPQFGAGFLSAVAAGTTIVLRKPTIEDLVRIAHESLLRSVRSFADGLGLTVQVEDGESLALALVLALCPEVDARRVAAEASGPLLDALLTGYAREDVESNKVLLTLGNAARQTLHEIMDGFHGKSPVDTCFRKSLGLHLSLDTRLSPDHLHTEVTGIALKHVPAPADYHGPGSLRAEVPRDTFSMIAGHDLVKERMREVVRLLRAPEKLASFDVSVPRGLLLFGPPGTGKTMLARALANEAELPFMAVSGAELLDPWLIRSVFMRARKYAPVVLFIDEIDAIGRRDGGGSPVIINQLLAEIDGFSTIRSDPVFIVAATNLREHVDPALLRSGRIDIHIEVPALDRAARQYFVSRFKRLPNDGSLNEDALLSATSGMSGADLERVYRECALQIVRDSLDQITVSHLFEQINTVKYGRRSRNKNLLEQFAQTAYHEAGHAVASLLLNPDISIEQITIQPRSDYLGFVSYDADSADGKQMNRQEVFERICICLAGRVAQSRKFGEIAIDSGASSDLAEANWWASMAVSQWGLDPMLPSLSMSGMHEDVKGCAAQAAFERTQAWLEAALAYTTALIDENWESVEAVTAVVLEREMIPGPELRALVKPWAAPAIVLEEPLTSEAPTP